MNKKCNLNVFEMQQLLPRVNGIRRFQGFLPQPAAVRKRLFVLWAVYPMVSLLAVSIASIGMQELLPDLWRKLLYVALFCSILAGLLIWLRSPTQSSYWPQVCLILAIAIVFSFLHAFNQKQSRERLQVWQESLHQMELDAEDGPSSWKPVACRAQIDASLRYRKASLLGGNHEIGEVGWQTITILRVNQIRIGGRWSSSSLHVPISIDGKITGYYPGDAVEVYGQWRLPSKPSNPGQYNQAKRFAELGYAAQARADSKDQLVRCDGTQHYRFDRLLAWVSSRTLNEIERFVVLGQAELAAALVLGQREQVEWRLQEDLLATGTIHMLSISGMHIEMVAMSLFLIGTLTYIPRRSLLVGVCIIVLGYALLCGANPPVARATMMLIGVCFAKWMGWRFSSMNMLAFAGVILILYRTSVVFETGAQLSFLAVAVLISSTHTTFRKQGALQKLIESKSSRWSKNARKLRSWSADMIRTSFWVWFITAPLVWTSFHVISPIAILLNLVLWIPMLIALISGMGLIVLGWFPPAGWLFGLLCGFSLWIVDGVVGFGESVPLGHFWLRSPPAWWLYSFYFFGIAAAFLGGVKHFRSRRRLLWVLGGWFLIGLGLQPTSDWMRYWTISNSSKLCFTFIDVGHGTNVVIETPDHQTWLYDAGRMGDHQRSYQVMIEALWAMNIPKLDAVVLSHADADHYNGLAGIAKRISIDRILSTQQVFEHASPLLQRNLATAKRYGSMPIVWKRGDLHQGQGWSTLAIHPPAQGVPGSDNANSLCLLFEYAGRKVLLPGDLEPPGLPMLVAQDATDVDLLMAPHHGSLNAKADLLLKWCQPETVVISGSTRAMSPRVLQMFEAAERQIFVTARDDAIRYEIASDGTVSVRHWSTDRWVNLGKP